MPGDRDLLDILLKRQKVLADFADMALQSDDLDEVLHEACRLVAGAMGTSRAKVLEIGPGGDSFLVRAGVGWAPDVVGHVRLSMREHSSESYSLQAGEPVISQDIGNEDRFDIPDFMRDAGVVALVNVPILLPGGSAYGLLQVDDTKPRIFDEDDSTFLRTYAGILGPIVDRLLKVQDLRSAQQRFRLTVETATDYAIFITDAEDRITDWLPGAAAVFGWSAEEALGQPADILYTVEDRAEGVPEWEVETAFREGSAPNVRWHVRKDGSRVFIEGSRHALHGIQGTAAGFLKIGQDVTERRQAQELREVLVAELQHRTRNLIAVVRSIARQTMNHTGPTEAFRETFDDRLEALSRVQGLLSRSEHEPITLRALLELELDALAAVESGQVTVEGPSVRIRSSVVQTLALAIHELATNARKYGALSEGGGRLSITWHLRNGDAGRRVHVEWHEEGLVPSDAVTASSRPEGGYGRMLIEQALPYALGAETTYELGPTELRCTIDLPLERVDADESSEP
jgi:PAS domain S-box-containing protein